MFWLKTLAETCLFPGWFKPWLFKLLVAETCQLCVVAMAAAD